MHRICNLINIGWTRFFLKFPLLRWVVYRSCYPYLTVGLGARLSVQGDFVYRKDSSVGEGANISVPTGARLHFGQGCYIGRGVEIGVADSVQLGDYSSIQDRCIILGDVSIGRYCLFASNVYVSSGRHYFDWQSSLLIKDQDALIRLDPVLFAEHSKPVVIEDDCWLGANVVVMAGVTISKGAVIGANSVVTKNVPPYTVFAGAPAKQIRQRLVFVPPDKIDYEEQDDLPYFYAGIEVDSASRLQHVIHQGLAIQGDFTLCLNPTGKTKLSLVVKSLINEVSIRMGQQEQSVNEIFKEIIFDLTCVESAYFTFLVTFKQANSKLIIQKAWVS